MMTVLEESTHRSVQQVLPEMAEHIKYIGDVLLERTAAPYVPKEDPTYCMDFDEWASRLDCSDRRRLMNFLWNSKEWHATCLREEDAPWDDSTKLEPPDISESTAGQWDDGDLPF